MGSSTIGFLIGILTGILIVFVSFSYGLTFEPKNQLNITILIVIVSLAGFGVGWLFEGIKPRG